MQLLLLSLSYENLIKIIVEKVNFKKILNEPVIRILY